MNGKGSSMRIILCTSDMVDSFKPFDAGVSCWLHFDEGAERNVRSIATKLLSLNCCHFAVSGPNALSNHDAIDEVAEGHRNLVLTTWHADSLRETAGEYLAVNCADCDNPIRLIVAVASDWAKETVLLSELAAGLRDELCDVDMK